MSYRQTQKPKKNNILYLKIQDKEKGEGWSQKDLLLILVDVNQKIAFNERPPSMEEDSIEIYLQRLF